MNATLPAPDADATQHSGHLAALIRAEIAAIRSKCGKR